MIEETQVSPNVTVKVVNHVLAQQTLSQLRDVETDQVSFRKGLVKLGRICGYEIADSEMEREEYVVETPLEETTGVRLKDDDVVIINVLRAATPFVEGLLKAFPSARQGVVSAGRNEEAGMEDGKFPITVDYKKMPEITSEDTVIIADPMLATGSTMLEVTQNVLDAGNPKKLMVLSAVSAPEGLEALNQEHPDVDLLTVSVDDGLNEEGFILPGLGDAGDRSFGTQ